MVCRFVRPASFVVNTRDNNWLAEWRPDGIAGFSVVIPRDDGDAELDGLFVEPDLMRRGIGTLLVREAEGRARRTGAQMLHVVANPQAQAFYLACGFITADIVATRFGRAILMGKTLSDRIDRA